MNFKEVCALFGGPSRVSRILGLKDKSCRDVRRAIADSNPRKHWDEKLRQHAKIEIEKLKGFIDGR